MKSCLICALGITILFSTLILAEPPPTQSWVARYNYSGTGHDEARAIAVDNSGNIYVTGYSEGSGTREDYATIKYGPNGNQLWVMRYNGPGNDDDEATVMAIDNSCVYVTGSSYGSSTGKDYCTIKYGFSGIQSWVSRYNYSGTSNDTATAMAIDNSGNVYVTGYSGTGSYEYATVKYNSSGAQQWVARYYNHVGDDKPAAIALDNSGNVYVTGSSPGSGTGLDYATMKIDTYGNIAWVKRYNGPGNGDDQATGIAVDNSGNIYVTGYCLVGDIDQDCITIKYDSSGNQLWLARYNGLGPDSVDFAVAPVFDNSGYVYVTGGSASAAGGWNYITMKYNPDNGNQLMMASYTGSGELGSYNYQIGYGLKVDNSGNIYVTGMSYGSGTVIDYATVKYNSDADQLWVMRYNGPGNGWDGAYGIALDNSGNVYVTGHSYGSGTDDDYCTIKYTQQHYCKGPIAGDLDGDCNVDLYDFAIMAANWLQCNYVNSGDCQ